MRTLCILGCPKNIKNAFFGPIFCMRLPLYLKRWNQKKSRVFKLLFSGAARFHFIKEIPKIYNIGCHFSHNGPINLISRPDCYTFKDASVDIHIEMTYVRHLSSAICQLCQISAMTDICPTNMVKYRSVFENVVIWSRNQIDRTILGLDL